MTVAAAAVQVVVVVIASFWPGLGNRKSPAQVGLLWDGGSLLTLALGIGLMALVFISSRRGYDEIVGRDL